MRELKFRMYALDIQKMFEIDRLHLPCTTNPNPASVYMQYTGLKDKNGVEIYEGDIVKVSEEYGGHAYSPLVVDFKDGGFVLRRINYMSDYNPMFKYDFTKVYEVIGNIYEID